MDISTSPSAGDTGTAPRWRPLSARERRVLGVLVEKAKTTPSGYPMTINAIRTGANQKSNRAPLMECEAEEIEQTLDDLREKGAVAEVISDGRVPKYRHYAYDWLGVDKVEIAVMTELLLRGAQTEGELRGRASRMERIADLSALREVLASLEAKKLIVRLTPQGRGHVISHALYQPAELEKLHRQFSSGVADDVSVGAEEPSTPASQLRSAAANATQAPVATPPPAEAAPVAGNQTAAENALIAELRLDVDELKDDLDALRREVAELRDALGG
ncbi:MAG: DUF480 domain-containing protein [Pirellulales bacterium]